MATLWAALGDTFGNQELRHSSFLKGAGVSKAETFMMFEDAGVPKALTIIMFEGPGVPEAKTLIICERPEVPKLRHPSSDKLRIRHRISSG